ncbi:hypothetical protein P7K49_018942, partial [Saguinus oedipus]
IGKYDYNCEHYVYCPAKCMSHYSGVEIKGISLHQLPVAGISPGKQDSEDTEPDLRQHSQDKA